MTNFSPAPGAVLYRTVWRWHFYAGLLVLPFIFFLSITGSIYLFKPQIDRWEERAWHGLSTVNRVSPDAQRAAALKAVPGGRFNSYRLPETFGDAAVIHLALPGNADMRDVAVAPDGRVIAITNPDDLLTAWVGRLHGSLLLGTSGSLIVEAAASWAIFLILSGLYLWWPRSRGLAGVLWPRLDQGGRVRWRDLHAVTGFWVSGLALVMLASGLPWGDGWATGFRFIRSQMGWVNTPQDWRGGIDLHAGHDHQAMAAMTPQEGLAAGQRNLSDIVQRARLEGMPFPALLSPPGAKARFGPGNGRFWKLTSEAQNRSIIRTVRYDAISGTVIDRQSFADKHVIDRIINYGIAWHEGQLFGWINQAIGVLTAAMLMLLAVSGTIMWWRKRPNGTLGAPPALREPQARIITAILMVLAILLPVLGLSLLLFWLVDRGIRALAPGMAERLGRA
ncbi:MAG: PepSY domain-containing protein [Sphingomonas sp.]|nr:PepSY domain-containing protein [Sphingomonas sp.]